MGGRIRLEEGKGLVLLAVWFYFPRTNFLSHTLPLQPPHPCHPKVEFFSGCLSPPPSRYRLTPLTALMRYRLRPVFLNERTRRFSAPLVPSATANPSSSYRRRFDRVLRLFWTFSVSSPLHSFGFFVLCWQTVAESAAVGVALMLLYVSF